MRLLRHRRGQERGRIVFEDELTVAFVDLRSSFGNRWSRQTLMS
jgi:hypothetical protein